MGAVKINTHARAGQPLEASGPHRRLEGVTVVKINTHFRAPWTIEGVGFVNIKTGLFFYIGASSTFSLSTLGLFYIQALSTLDTFYVKSFYVKSFYVQSSTFSLLRCIVLRCIAPSGLGPSQYKIFQSARDLCRA